MEKVEDHASALDDSARSDDTSMIVKWLENQLHLRGLDIVGITEQTTQLEGSPKRSWKSIPVRPRLGGSYQLDSILAQRRHPQVETGSARSVFPAPPMEILPGSVWYSPRPDWWAFACQR